MPGKYRSGVTSPLMAAFVSGGNWSMQSNPSQDGTIFFGTMNAPSRFVDSTTALGLDYWNFFSGKNGGGIRMVLGIGNRGGSFGDDCYIGWSPASGSGFNASNARIECRFLSGSIYQFRFALPDSASGAYNEVFRLDGGVGAAAGGGRAEVRGGFMRPMIAAAKTGNYTMVLSDYSVKGDTTGGAFTITLPDATTCAGQEFEIKRINAGANALTVKSVAGTLDGAAAGTGFTMTVQYQARTLRSDGTNWHIVSAHL